MHLHVIFFGDTSLISLGNAGHTWELWRSCVNDFIQRLWRAKGQTRASLSQVRSLWFKSLSCGQQKSKSFPRMLSGQQKLIERRIIQTYFLKLLCSTVYCRANDSKTCGYYLLMMMQLLRWLFASVSLLRFSTIIRPGRGHELVTIRSSVLTLYMYVLGN